MLVTPIFCESISITAFSECSRTVRFSSHSSGEPQVKPREWIYPVTPIKAVWKLIIARSRTVMAPLSDRLDAFICPPMICTCACCRRASSSAPLREVVKIMYGPSGIWRANSVQVEPESRKMVVFSCTRLTAFSAMIFFSSALRVVRLRYRSSVPISTSTERAPPWVRMMRLLRSRYSRSRRSVISDT